jgi:hypothetical protein
VGKILSIGVVIGIGQIRQRQSAPFFRQVKGLPYGSFSRLVSKISKGEYSGKKVDWGAYAARVSKRQILDFIEEAYGESDWYTNRAKMPHLYQRLQELIRCVQSLSDNRDFALVATEF